MFLFYRCKSENTKLTSALNVLAAFAIFRLYHNHNARLPVSYNVIPVSFRNFRPACDIGPLQIGHCTGPLMTLVPNPLSNPNDDSELSTKFWPLAREQSVSLETRAKNDYSKFRQRVSLRLEDVRGLECHLSISNIGVIDLSSYECFRDDNNNNENGFHVENMFTTVTSFPILDKFLTAIFFTTIGDQLCCALGNNSFYFDPQVAQQFVDYFRNILDCIIE